MPFVKSASRRVRKIGQVLVLGFSSAMSAAVRGMWRCLLRLGGVFNAVGKEDEVGPLGSSGSAAEDERGELEPPVHVLEEPYCGSRSRRGTPAAWSPSDRLKNSLVVSSVAMPEGTSRPAKPLGATSLRANSAKSM